MVSFNGRQLLTRTRDVLGTDLGAAVRRLSNAADRRIGSRARRGIAALLLAGTLAGSAAAYIASRPLEEQYETTTTSYVITATVAHPPTLHVVQPGETLWSIVRDMDEHAPAATVARSVQGICADNDHVVSIDNRSVHNGVPTIAPDGIGCDVLLAGTPLYLPAPPPTLTKRLHTATYFNATQRARPYDTGGLLFAALLATSTAGIARILREPSYIALQQAVAALPHQVQRDPHARYRPQN